MSAIHRRVFGLYVKELDGQQLNPTERAELHAHISSCPDCRANQQLYQRLRKRTEQRLPAVPAPIALETILQGKRRGVRLRWVTLPLRMAIWAGLILLALILLQQIFTGLRPTPAVQPTVITPPDQATPGVPVQPLLQGEPYGRGMWSPEEDYYFVPILDNPPPGGDRRSTSLHFISAATGEDCPASETFLGHQGSDQNYAWLDNERVVYIDIQGRTHLFTRCQAGSQDLSGLFAEPLLRVAHSLTSPELSAHGLLLLESPSAYWLLDPLTLQARPLADPLPTSDIDVATLESRALKEPIPWLMLEDSFAWPPSRHQISVLQPIEGDLERSHLVLLDLDTGQVLRSLDVNAYSEGFAPSIEWMGPDRPFVWGFGTGGPLLVDLSVDPPQQVHVLPELFGFDLAYPDDIFSMGVFYSASTDSFHIVVHTNLPGDISIYLYHSESGLVEKLDGNRQVMMILPGDQRMPIAPLQDLPTYDDGFDLVWVDAPDRPQTRLEVIGHMPRNHDTLASRLLPGGTRMLFGSTQGVSLVDLLSGETLAFWRLAGMENKTSLTLTVSPDGRALIATANPGGSSKEEYQGGLVYWIGLEEPVTASSP